MEDVVSTDNPTPRVRRVEATTRERSRELDRKAVGRRIRQLRLAAGLRQRELAEHLGTTQSAIHKYEHGTLPEPGRLLQLADIGNTTIEWLLTGRHWPDGSKRQQRASRDVMATANLLEAQSEADRVALDAALRLIQSALTALDTVPEGTPASRSLRAHAQDTMDLLEAARRVQVNVFRQLAADAGKRLSNSWFDRADDDRRGTEPPEGGSRPKAG